MIVARTPAAMARLSGRWRARGLSIGLVPTMGALHEGHASLIRRARRENARVAVSIFVNPTQFGPNEDYARYPRTFAADLRLARAAGADAVYHPTPEAMYPEGFQTVVDVPALADGLCGRSRPGHFRGVATVVLKLLAATRPDRAYFGEKDFQQLAVVRRMAADLDLGARIVGCPTVREKDGLALSSRNRYLSPAERALAPELHRALAAAAAGNSPARVIGEARRRLARVSGLSIDYVALVDAETLAPAKALKGRLRLLAAVRLGSTRLIDNIPVSC